MVFIWHFHDNIFGKGKPLLDRYFVFLLRVKMRAITPQFSEIGEARWLSVQDFLASAGVKEVTRHVTRVALSGKGLGAGWHEGYGQAKNIRDLRRLAALR